MAYPMIALTTAGTSFACASVSLTETGLAVLDDNGSRTGFVPYDSLEYVAPTEEARVTDAPMRVLTEDGSGFGAASVSQAAAGVAVQDHSGSRIGFVPYDTLTYVLPEAKTGPTLPADATPLEGVNIDGEDDGGGPVWEGDRERSDEHGEEASNEDTSDDSDSNVDRSGNDNDSDPHPGADDGDESDGDGVWGDDPVEESDREAGDDGSGDEGTEDESSESGDDAAESDGEMTRGEGDEDVLPCGCIEECTCDAQEGEEAESGSDAPSDAENGQREEAEESELVVEWSFGDDE